MFSILLLGSLVRAQDATPVFRAGVNDVRVPVQVIENGVVLRGLTKADFSVWDRDEPQPVISGDRQKEQLDLLLLLDISGSMGAHIDEMAAKAREALHHLAPADRIAVMTFAKRTHLHFDFFDNHAEVERQLATATDDQEKVGYTTQINAAVLDAVRFMEKDENSGQRAILMVTDNLSMNENVNDRMVIGYLHKANVVFNAIVVGYGIPPGPPKPGDDPNLTPANVFKLADETGGEAVRAERAAGSFAQMVERIRERYSVTYHLPQSARFGEFRTIRVDLSPAARRVHPAAEVRARAGYYANF